MEVWKGFLTQAGRGRLEPLGYLGGLNQTAKTAGATSMSELRLGPRRFGVSAMSGDI
jgi:hypothetical protein